MHRREVKREAKTNNILVVLSLDDVLHKNFKHNVKITLPYLHTWDFIMILLSVVFKNFQFAWVWALRVIYINTLLNFYYCCIFFLIVAVSEAGLLRNSIHRLLLQYKWSMDDGCISSCLVMPRPDVYDRPYAYAPQQPLLVSDWTVANRPNNARGA